MREKAYLRAPYMHGLTWGDRADVSTARPKIDKAVKRRGTLTEGMFS